MYFCMHGCMSVCMHIVCIYVCESTEMYVVEMQNAHQDGVQHDLELIGRWARLWQHWLLGHSISM